MPPQLLVTIRLLGVCIVCGRQIFQIIIVDLDNYTISYRLMGKFWDTLQSQKGWNRKKRRPFSSLKKSVNKGHSVPPQSSKTKGSKGISFEPFA